jgi:hypothetical protein
MYLSLWLIYSSKIILGIKYKIREIKNNINFQHINQWWVSIFLINQTNNLYIESIFFFQDLISFLFLIIFNPYISFNFFNLNDKFRFSKSRTCSAVRPVLASSSQFQQFFGIIIDYSGLQGLSRLDWNPGSRENSKKFRGGNIINIK